MKAGKRFSSFQAKRKLMRQLDVSLLMHATALCSAPSIEQVYRLRGLAETHFLLKNTSLRQRMSRPCSASLIRWRSRISAVG